MVSTGPTPGMVITRLAPALAFARATISRSRLVIFTCRVCSRREGGVVSRGRPFAGTRTPWTAAVSGMDVRMVLDGRGASLLSRQQRAPVWMDGQAEARNQAGSPRVPGEWPNRWRNNRAK